jgi:hypothetical protein
LVATGVISGVEGEGERGVVVGQAPLLDFGLEGRAQHADRVAVHHLGRRDVVVDRLRSDSLMVGDELAPADGARTPRQVGGNLDAAADHRRVD